jgi:hypothetical protein
VKRADKNGPTSQQWDAVIGLQKSSQERRMSKNGEKGMVPDQSDSSLEEELSEEDLDEMDGGDGGQVTYPPYL